MIIFNHIVVVLGPKIIVGYLAEPSATACRRYDTAKLVASAKLLDATSRAAASATSLTP